MYLNLDIADLRIKRKRANLEKTKFNETYFSRKSYESEYP